MAAEPLMLFALDLAGTFAFALNGGLTAVRLARVDIVGVITLAVITAVGGGIIRRPAGRRTARDVRGRALSRWRAPGLC